MIHRNQYVKNFTFLLIKGNSEKDWRFYLEKTVLEKMVCFPGIYQCYAGDRYRYIYDIYDHSKMNTRICTAEYVKIGCNFASDKKQLDYLFDFIHLYV